MTFLISKVYFPINHNKLNKQTKCKLEDSKKLEIKNLKVKELIILIM